MLPREPCHAKVQGAMGESRNCLGELGARELGGALRVVTDYPHFMEKETEA